jgi:hypothetical protein
MSNRDTDAYRMATMIQHLGKFLEHSKPHRHLGLADERCPRCGDLIETLLDNMGRNPLRCCWRCDAEDSEHG